MSLDSPSPVVPDRSSPEADVSGFQKDAVAGYQNGGAAAATEEAQPTRRIRPSRACTLRALQRFQEQQAAERRHRPVKKEQRRKQELEEDDEGGEEDSGDEAPEHHRDCDRGSTRKIVTSLVAPPEPAQIPRWSLRSMWQLSSVLNFLHIFRPLLNINAEYSAEEFETALLAPNDTLSDIHIPLLKAIPPITRMALTRDTWITVLCRKLKDWWHWVAKGDLPIVASHGLEVEVYKSLDPGIRVVILKALCDIRVEQEDIKNYIDNSLKHGVHLSVFRKERVGGDSYGVNYWYEDDALIGHRLYREIRKAESIKAKTKGSKVLPNVTYQWETVATNFDEFQDVSEKLFTSKNKTEASLGKKLKNGMLPEIEKEHKRKERLLKKQHRQALLLDNFLVVDGLAAGRSLRDRKPVRYTFDDYDRSINEAIKITKNKHPSPEPPMNRREFAKSEASENGGTSSPHPSEPMKNAMSPGSPYYDDVEEHTSEPLDRSNRRRQRPQRYSAKEFVETLSDNEADFDSDDDIVGEAVYDEEYLRKRKQRKKYSSGSEGEEEYRWDEDNAEDEEEEEEEEEDSLSISEEDSDEPQVFKKVPGLTSRETKSRLRSRSHSDRQPNLRRSKRATRNRINYRQYELSESDREGKRPSKSKRVDDPDERDEPDERSDETQSEDFSMGSQEYEENDDEQETKVDNRQPVYHNNDETIGKEKTPFLDKSNGTDQDEIEGMGKRCFLDLNELAPVSGFEDGPNPVVKEDDNTNT